MSKCKGCGSDIVWIKTAAGKSMPCDDPPVLCWENPKGKSTVITEDGRTIRCDLEGDDINAAKIGYVPHWATCPAAKRFKKSVKCDT